MKQKDILIILISTFILVVAWIGFNIYHNSVTSTISETLGVRISPINPDFNIKDINALKERKKVTPILDATASLATPSATPTTQPTPSTPTPSPIITPTPSISINPTSVEGTPTP